MNKSFSKLRTIQNANLLIESRKYIINESLDKAETEKFFQERKKNMSGFPDGSVVELKLKKDNKTYYLWKPNNKDYYLDIDGTAIKVDKTGNESYSTNKWISGMDQKVEDEDLPIEEY